MPARSLQFDNSRAATLTVLAMLLIGCNDAIMKSLSRDYSISQLILVRGVIALVLVIAAIRFSGQRLVTEHFFSAWNGMRGLTEVLATFCFIYSLSVLPIGLAVTLLFTAPVMLSMLAAAVLKENVSIRRWLALAIGFAGVVVISRPSSGFGWLLLLPLLAAVFVAFRDLITTRVNPALGSMHVVLLTTVMVTLTAAALAWTDWKPLGVSLISMLTLSAVLLCTGFSCMIMAVRIGQLSFISPFTYCSIIVAMVTGYLVWGDVPGLPMLAGAGMIFLSGFIVLSTRRTG